MEDLDCGREVVGDWEEVTSVVADWERLFVALLCKEESAGFVGVKGCDKKVGEDSSVN